MMPNLRGVHFFVAMGYQGLATWYSFGQYSAFFRRDLDATYFALGFCILATLAAFIGAVAVPLVKLRYWPDTTFSDWGELWLPIFGILVLSLAGMLTNFCWMRMLEAAERQNLQPPVMPKQSLMDLMLLVLAISAVLGGWNAARMWHNAFENSLSPVL